MFRIGQKVINIDPNCPYTPKIGHIKEITICPNCGLMHLSIEEWPIRNGQMECTDCDENTGHCTRAGTDHREFRPLQDNFAEETLSKAIEDAKEIEEIIETIEPKKIWNH